MRPFLLFRKVIHDAGDSRSQDSDKNTGKDKKYQRKHNFYQCFLGLFLGPLLSFTRTAGLNNFRDNSEYY